MRMKLFFQAITRFFLGVLFVGLSIFVPAGSLHYIEGWILMGVLFIPMFCAGVVLLFRNPELLKKRLKAKEEQNEQKMVIGLSGLMFVAGFVLAGLHFRFGWYHLPHWVSRLSLLVFLVAYLLYAEVIRENPYLSRIVEVTEEQKLIDGGLYGIVRHPMYTVSLLLFLTMPLILGSVHAFLIFLAYPFLIVKRIRGEEKVLEQELVGYSDYQSRVKYRLIPFIW
ncbi:MAG: isoprenylcysteine carboxylmethyltransferase family protein [Clostridia bacterium]|nr:isoprenylcysteine carboxylmethyltransferase family protein [Clostridia bacterium]